MTSVTHKERRERIEAVVADAKAGALVEDIAKRHKLTKVYVQQVICESGMKPRTYARDRIESRDQAIVDALAAGESMESLRLKYQTETIRRACAKHGVEPPELMYHEISSNSYRVLARLINTDDSGVKIAADFQISRERVRQIAERAKAAGIRLHERRKQ